MREQVLKEIESCALLNTQAPIVLALSGGVDSMVLLDALIALKKNIIIAHVNHKKRIESDDEALALKKIAAEHALPFLCHTIPSDLDGNFQAKSREIRYDFFKRVADQYNSTLILTAHHYDDQIETFFMRLLSNKDTLSLKGMEPITSLGDYTLIRPLLTIEKETLIAYATQHKVLYFEDPSNTTNTYFRNAIRNKVLPAIKTHVPDYKNAVNTHIQSIQMIDELTKTLAATFLASHPDTVSVQAFLDLTAIVQKQVLTLLLKEYNHQPYLSQGQTEEIIKALTADKNFILPLTKALNLHKEYGVFFFKQSAPTSQKSIQIHTTGHYRFDETNEFVVTEEKINHKTSKYHELWYNNEVFPIHIRNRAKGDYIEFEYGRKKLKDYLIDKKIPPHKRDALIVVAKGNKILYIPELSLPSIKKSGSHKLYIYHESNPM